MRGGLREGSGNFVVIAVASASTIGTTIVSGDWILRRGKRGRCERLGQAGTAIVDHLAITELKTVC